ncbi:hypothetical protein NKH70_33990, partial [Mesorhizobium sp. M0991]|uniref:hypothetical protein n=1 Tax=Mesorhizobium sp. M0991 TaxID=2957043 RepID=UPI00333A3451
SQGVHLFWWTPHASEHSTAKGAGKFALTLERYAAGERVFADLDLDDGSTISAVAIFERLFSPVAFSLPASSAPASKVQTFPTAM